MAVDTTPDGESCIKPGKYIGTQLITHICEFLTWRGVVGPYKDCIKFFLGNTDH